MIVALLLAAQAQVVAVLEFRDKVPAEQRIDAAYLSDQVRAAVKQDMPSAKVITRENMLVLLQASGKTLEECEGECEVDTGRRIGADLVVSGELLKFGTQYKLNMKLHDTGSGDLLSGVVAAGATADDLDRDLKPAVDKLLAPILRRERSERRERRPSTVIGGWLLGGYDSADHPENGSNTSGFGWHAGAHLFLRVVGPLYLGGIFDYSFSNVRGPLFAGGLRFLVGEVTLSGGFGFTDETNNGAGNGVGALAAIDFAVGSGFCLRAQGSWRRAGSMTPSTLLAASGGVAFNF